MYEWHVGQKKGNPYLRAGMGKEPSHPPLTGWKFYNKDTRKYEEDPRMTCCIPTSPPCCLTVSLSGPAKEKHAICEGEYRDTGLRSLGKPVIMICKEKTDMMTTFTFLRFSNWRVLKIVSCW